MKKTTLSVLATSLFLTFATSSAAIADKIRLLPNDMDALTARRDLMKDAKSEILVEYYATGRDQMTAAAMSLLIERARAGIKVKMIIDSHANELPMGMVQDIIRQSAVRLSVEDETKVQQNMEVKLYNQLTTLPSLHSIMHRDHAKLLVVDGKAAVMGGRNGTSEYFGLNPGHNFIDMDLVLFGKSAKDIRANFMTLWDSSLVAAPEGGEKKTMKDKIYDFCKPRPGMYKSNSSQEWLNCMNRMIYEEKDGKLNIFELAKGDFSEKLVSYEQKAKKHDWEAEAIELPDADVYFVSQKADQFNSKAQNVSLLTDEYLAEIREAKHEIRITTPYLLATNAFFEALKEVRSKGVRVQVITNSATSTDSDLFYAGYRTHLQRMIDLGVEIYEIQGKDTLHAKTALIDNETLIIGSYNLDPRSSYINREVALIMHDRNNMGLAKGLADFNDKLLNHADFTKNEDESASRTGIFQWLYIKALVVMDPVLMKVL